MHRPNLKSVASSVPEKAEIIAIEVWCGLRTPNLGEEEAVGGRGWSYGTVRKSVGEFLYRLSIVTFPLSLRVSEILPPLCSSTPPFSTPPLVSPKFPHVPLGVARWMAFGLRKAKVLG